MVATESFRGIIFLLYRKRFVFSTFVAMKENPEILASCTASLHPVPHTRSITRIVGITALVSFAAGTVVGTACNSKDTKRKDLIPPTQPMIPSAHPVEQQKIEHMLFPEVNDLLYRPMPNPEPPRDKGENKDGVML